MSAKISACWMSSGILLGFVLFVRSEHFYLPKENNVFSGDPKDDWIPVSGIDKRSTRFSAADHHLTRVVHITPPVRYPPSDRPQAMDTDESNKIEVFAQPPPTILGSFSDFGHATVEAREPAHALNFRPSAFDRLYDEVDDRRFRQHNDYRGEPVQDEQKPPPPPAIVVFNAQQRHPQNYHKTSAPTHAQYYQNFQYREVNNKNAGYNKEQDPPRRLAPYLVPNEHVYPRPAASQGNNKPTYVEQRPKPYLVNPSEPIHQHHHHHHQQHQKQQQQQQQSYKLQPSSTEGGEYFQKYHPGRVVESQNPYPPPVSTFARPFELQTGGGDRNVFIRPDQYVQDLNVGTEVRFAATAAAGSQEQHDLQQQQHRPSSSRLQPAVPLDVSVSTAAAGFAHPATRPFSKYQTPTPKNEELYRIFPVKEVNALPPTFLPTPITLLHDMVQSSEYGRPKTTTSRPTRFKEPSWDGSSEYEAQEQDENESGEQSYDVLRSPTKPVPTTTTTTTSTAAPPPPPRVTRKRKPMTTTTTTTVAPDEYDEYAVPNRQQLQLQEQFQPEEYRETTTSTTVSTTASTTTSSTTTSSTTTSIAAEEERPLPVSVNKYKKKKPLPATRPKEPQPSAEEQLDVTPSPSTVTTTTTTAPPSLLSQSSPDTAAADTRAKTKAKYGNGTRPRFSIKDFKTSTTSTTTSTEKAPSGRRTTTTTTTTAEPETVVEQQTARKRYRPRPNRYKMGTSTTAPTTTTTTEEQQRQETATASAYRSKYKPGGKYHNRLRTSTELAAQAADEGGESAAAATEPTRPMYSAKRRTVPTVRTTDAATADEHNAVRRSSSASPLDDDVTPPEPLDAASSEDVDYVATTVAVTSAVAPPRHKYHTSYAAERPLLPIESFFQSSMAASKRYHNHNKRR